MYHSPNWQQSPNFVLNSRIHRAAVNDIPGNEVDVLIQENIKSVVYSVDWNASQFPSGIYFYTLKTGSFKETKKMILLK